MTKPAKRRSLGQSLIGHFWSLIDRRGPDECWPWVGGSWTGEPGTSYGKFAVGGRYELAHRFMLEMRDGPIGRKHALHHCDNPPCVNPAHLYPGTPKDNGRDRSARGRVPEFYGVFDRFENRPLADLMEERGIGARGLARAVGSNYHAALRWLHGARPTRRYVAKLKEWLGPELSYEEFFGPPRAVHRFAHLVPQIAEFRSNGMKWREIADRLGFKHPVTPCNLLKRAKKDAAQLPARRPANRNHAASV